MEVANNTETVATPTRLRCGLNNDGREFSHVSIFYRCRGGVIDDILGTDAAVGNER